MNWFDKKSFQIKCSVTFRIEYILSSARFGWNIASRRCCNKVMSERAKDRLTKLSIFCLFLQCLDQSELYRIVALVSHFEWLVLFTDHFWIASWRRIVFSRRKKVLGDPINKRLAVRLKGEKCPKSLQNRFLPTAGLLTRSLVRNILVAARKQRPRKAFIWLENLPFDDRKLAGGNGTWAVYRSTNRRSCSRYLESCFVDAPAAVFRFAALNRHVTSIFFFALGKKIYWGVNTSCNLHGYRFLMLACFNETTGESFTPLNPL